MTKSSFQDLGVMFIKFLTCLHSLVGFSCQVYVYRFQGYVYNYFIFVLYTNTCTCSVTHVTHAHVDLYPQRCPRGDGEDKHLDHVYHANGVITMSAVCLCGKVFKNLHGLKIQQVKMECLMQVVQQLVRHRRSQAWDHHYPTS